MNKILSVFVTASMMVPVTSIAAASTCGLIVESVAPGSLLEAGLRPGDELYNWTRLANPPSRLGQEFGDLCAYSDWADLRLEQAPRGPVELEGIRAGEAWTTTVQPGDWAAIVRPRLDQKSESHYFAGKVALSSGDKENAIAHWIHIPNDLPPEESIIVKEWLGILFSNTPEVSKTVTQNSELLCASAKSANSAVTRAAAWDALGRTYWKHKEFDLAEDALSIALAMRNEAGFHELSAASSLASLANLVHDMGQLDRAISLEENVLQQRLASAPTSIILTRSYNNLANYTKERGELDRAEAYFLKALEIQEKFDPESVSMALYLNNLGSLELDRENLTKAELFLTRALDLRERLAPESEEIASILTNLATISSTRGNLAAASDYLARALSIREVKSPNSLKLGAILNNLGLIAAAQGKLEIAYKYLIRDLEISETFAQESLEIATSLNNLGTISQMMGDLGSAMSFHERALRIREKLAPDTRQVAGILNNLGTLALGRGQIEDAYSFYRRALDIDQRIDPKGISTTDSLGNLGLVYHLRGDDDRARTLYLEALQISEQNEPNGKSVAVDLDLLSDLELGLGNIDQARSYQVQALKIHKSFALESIDVAHSEADLGSIEASAGNWIKAREHYLVSKRILEKTAPSNLILSIVLANLGDVAHQGGESKAAIAYYQRAVALQEEFAPNRERLAIDYNSMAKIFEQSDAREQAGVQFRKAVETLERQVSLLGGSLESQASYRAKFAEIYRDYQNFLLRKGDLENAFNIEERFRARSFLISLAERDLSFTQDVPEELDRERHQLRFQYEQSLDLLRTLDLAADSAKIASVRQDLEALEQQSDELKGQIRSASKRLAALRYPQPLVLKEARRALDPGTLMLAFSVDTDKTTIFALSGQDVLTVKSLPVGDQQLRAKVEHLRRALEEGQVDSSTSAWRRRQFEKESSELFSYLIEPFADRIEKNQRILILPDGPLHSLPFGSLLRRDSSFPGSMQYLLEWRPIHIVQSMTVYGELKQRRPTTAKRSLSSFVAFGDPLEPLNPNSSGQTTPSFGITNLSALPYSRREIEGIASLFPEGTAQTYLGSEAKERRIKTLDSNTRILHLSAHARTDERFPMSSFIALAPDESFPGSEAEHSDNGLFQVWEILEQFRLDADLVVLSACETGLGKELGGEGIIGLTRAFQFAGARSVIASLWQVSDASTSELMIRFYRHLSAGLTKDEALRAAQIELIHGSITIQGPNGEAIEKDASAPYHWAAFQVYGDWQ